MSCNVRRQHLFCSRRQVLLGAAAFSAGCGSRAHTGTIQQVSITRAEKYSQDLYEIVRGIFYEHRVDVKGKRVVLKPNLVEFEENGVINTDPLVVHAAYEAIKALGAERITIAEGPGHRRATLEMCERAGYYGLLRNFESAFVDLNLDEVTRVDLRRPASKLSELYLPQTILAADLVVSIPKMKTHHWVGATLSMKNLFGIVPGGVYGWPKNVLHWAGIDECIADLYRMVPKHFCLVDGIDGMEGNGPIQGEHKHTGVLVAGADMAAVDATCCRIMGIDPRFVGYLRLSNPATLDSGNIRQIGVPVAAVRTEFRLMDEWKHLRLTTI